MLEGKDRWMEEALMAMENRTECDEERQRGIKGGKKWSGKSYEKKKVGKDMEYETECDKERQRITKGRKSWYKKFEKKDEWMEEIKCKWKLLQERDNIMQRENKLENKRRQNGEG